MRVLVTGLSTYWGGRLAQSLEQDPEVETIIGIDRRPPKVALERTEFVQVADAHSLIQRIVHAAEIDTVIDTRLVVDSTVDDADARPREQRRRHDEHPRRVQRPGHAGAQARLPLERALLRRRAGRPRVLHRGRWSARTRRARGSSATSSTPRHAVAGLRRLDRAGEGRASCASPRASAPGMRTAVTRLLRLPAVPAILGFDPRFQCIHEDDIVGIARARGAPRHGGRSTTARPTACSRSARSPACSASRCCRSSRRGGPAWRRSSCAALGLEHPRRAARACCATAAA